ncbi:uncharacterized protein LOC6560707 [Drosophila grimshawi]|uniref:GH19760 n=1 Tax=Drosophila grimshawi TaxID=7222 RepID=B4J452_DROGR|nr:uncharacterized protein LOC6560707 [Drosophila grimshawi]EDW02658.1 GH19760 [Drosophila grimshawi]
MSTTQPTDVQYLRCLKCLKIVKCSRYDTSCLVRHVQKDHPEMLDDTNDKVTKLHKLAADHGISQERVSEISRMTGLSEEELADKAERYLERKQRSSSQKDANGDKKFEKSSKSKRPKAADSQEKNRRQYYRCSIERWIPVEGCIYCPNCGCKRRPLIMTSSEFYASTDCSSCCVSSFWPFCFLPCFSTGDNREYLHCSNCKTFLAIYDRERNCIRPNSKFVGN